MNNFLMRAAIDLRIQTLLWVIVCLSGLLAAYMAYAHQLIRWQRARGLLARQSHGLYWAVLRILKGYKWIFMITMLTLAAGLTYFGIPERVRQVLWMMDTDVSKSEPLNPRTEDKETASLGDLRQWVNQLEERRLEFPQEYCSRVERGVLAFEQLKKPAAIIKLKLRYLKSEYQKNCPPTASK